MNKQKYNKLVLFGFLALLITMFAGFFLLYTSFSESNKLILSQVNAKAAQIESELVSLQERTKEERLILEDQMLTNFKKLEDSINKETGKIKLDLESQLKDVYITFDEKNLELYNKISSIDVQSSDFSAIIDDVIKGVVGVKTNKGSGSGVIFDSRGYLMTNRHVIEDVNAITVVDYEGKKYSVAVIAVGQDIDLAILKIQSEETFTALKFANDEDIKVGTKVIAVGNPLGLSFTVTEGIISSKNRIIDGKEFIQTDVPINPGNSGGPLVNADKRIVGINTFKISNTEGLGFAIPASFAKDMAERIVN